MDRQRKHQVNIILVISLALVLVTLTFHQKNISETGNVSLIETLSNTTYLLGIAIITCLVGALYTVGNRKKENVVNEIDMR